MRPLVRTTLAAAGMGAAAMAAVFIQPLEGTKLEAYRDAVGVWTICTGHTGGVRPGDVATEAECDALFRSDLGRFLGAVDAAIRPEIPDASLAAFTSVCFNLGLHGCRKIIARVNAGRTRDACEAIPLYVYAGGRDCREPRSGCRGIVERRAAERELCLAGLGAAR